VNSPGAIGPTICAVGAHYVTRWKRTDKRMEPHSAVYDQSRCARCEACRLRDQSARLNVPPVIVPVDVCQGDAAGELVERGSHAQNRLPVLPGFRVATRAEDLKQLRRSSLREEILIYKVREQRGNVCVPSRVVVRRCGVVKEGET